MSHFGYSIRASAERPWSRAHIFTVRLSPRVELPRGVPELTIHMAVDEYSLEAIGEIVSPAAPISAFFRCLVSKLPYRIKELYVYDVTSLDRNDFQDEDLRAGAVAYFNPQPHFSKIKLAAIHVERWYHVCSELAPSSLEKVDINEILKRVNNEVPLLVNKQTPTQRRNHYFRDLA